MKKLLLIVLLIVGCDETWEHILFGPSNDAYCINLTITEKEASNTFWKVSGMAINEGWNNYYSYWKLKAYFDTTNSNTTSSYLGTEIDTIYANKKKFGRGDTLYWELYHYNDNIIESDYPDFVVKNLNATYDVGSSIQFDPGCP